MYDAGQILGRGRPLLEEGGIAIQVAMVETSHDFAIEDRLQILEVEKHSGHGIRLPPQGHLQAVVVTVLGRQRPEELAIRLIAEIGQPVSEGAAEVDCSCDPEQFRNLLKFKTIFGT